MDQTGLASRRSGILGGAFRRRAGGGRLAAQNQIDHNFGYVLYYTTRRLSLPYVYGMELAPKGDACATKLELLTAYRAVTKSYSDTIAEVAQKIGIVSKAEYEKLNVAVLKARRLSAHALEALEAHTDEHGC